MRFYVAIVILLMLANMISVFSLIFIERKDPTTTWAWLLILMLIPGIGFIIYLLLGQNLSRQKIFREKKIIDKTRAAGLEEMQEIRGIKKELQDEYSDLILMNYNHCGSIYTTGNEVKTYISGEKKFQDLIKDIRAAKKFIHIEYYIFRFDDLGKAIINELKERLNTAVILITHDFGVVAGMADKIAVMYAGQIIEKGEKRDIFYNPKHPYTWALLNSVPKLEWKEKQVLDTIKGTPPDLIAPPKGCAFAARCKYCMNICLEEEPKSYSFEGGHAAKCWLYSEELPNGILDKIMEERKNG